MSVLTTINKNGVDYDLKDKYAERIENKVAEWQEAPDDVHYPSEKLVKDTIDNIDGLSSEVKSALLDCFSNVAWANANGQTYYDALYDALYDTPTPPTPPTPTPSECVTDGLIAYWDGIDNTGTGTHSSSALAWTDLVNGYEFPLYETVNTTWDANALVLHGNSAQGSITDSPLWEALSTSTVELVLKPEATGHQCVLCLDTAAQKVGDFYSSRRFGLFADNTVCFDGDRHTQYTNPLSSLTAIRKMAATYTGFTVVNGYVNGTQVSLSSYTHSYRAQTRKFIIGSQTPAVSSENDYYTGKIYAIRVYNRRLTLEELAQNDAYDNSRFSLGM